MLVKENPTSDDLHLREMCKLRDYSREYSNIGFITAGLLWIIFPYAFILFVFIKDGIFEYWHPVPLLFIVMFYNERLKKKRLLLEIIRGMIRTCLDFVEDDFQKKREGAIREPINDHYQLIEALDWSSFTRQYSKALEKIKSHEEWREDWKPDQAIIVYQGSIFSRTIYNYKKRRQKKWKDAFEKKYKNSEE